MAHHYHRRRVDDTAGTDDTDDRGDGDGGSGRAPTRRRRRALRWVVLAAGLVLVAGVVVPLVLYLDRERPGARSVDDAIDRLRRGGSTAPDGEGGDAPRRPAAGVYEALGSGGASISFPPASQEDGAVMPVSIEHLEGDCFRFRIDYNVARWHQMDLCWDDDALGLANQVNSQRWDFGAVTVENVSRYTCDPPSRWLPRGAGRGSADGEVTTAECTGTSTAVDGSATSRDRTRTVGVEELELEGGTVRAVHVSQRTEIEGAQRGRNEVELWLAADTGLPVRFERRYDLETDSPVGAIGYTEEGRWQLRSVEPRN